MNLVGRRSARAVFLLLEEVSQKLARIPKLPLAFIPTPLSSLSRLSKHLGGPNIWMKHENQTGLALGGNKTRKLQFAMRAAVDYGATHVITCGAQQSNHARQTAAAAAKNGVKCHIIFENRRDATMEKNRLYLQNGNVLLIDMLGATHEEFPGGSDMNALMKQAAEKIESEGGKPFIVPGGSSDPTGSTGYVECAVELMEQADEIGLQIDHVVTASGSAGTHAGLATGFQAVGSDVKLLGIGTRAPQDAQEDKVYKLTLDIAKHLGISESLMSRDYIKANCNFIGSGYGEPAEGTIDAILTVARTEGYILEPAYTGKAMDGLINLVKDGYFKDDENVVFIHTGGEAAIFGYEDEVRARL